MVLANSCRIPPVPHYSGYYSLILIYAYRTFTSYGLSFQIIQLKSINYS